MEAARHVKHASTEPVRITNRGGRSPLVLVCDHASNFLPAQFGTLGLQKSDLERHIAWDPGAQPVALRMAEALDAVLVESCISRLVIDCNRPLDAPDLIPPLSETTAIPGNADLSAETAQRAHRAVVAAVPCGHRSGRRGTARAPAADDAGLDPFLHAGLSRQKPAMADRRHP